MYLLFYPIRVNLFSILKTILEISSLVPKLWSIIFEQPFFFHPVFNILANTIITNQSRFFPFVVHRRRNNFWEKNLEASFDDAGINWISLENRIGKWFECSWTFVYARVCEIEQESVGDEMSSSRGCQAKVSNWSSCLLTARCFARYFSEKLLCNVEAEENYNLLEDIYETLSYDCGKMLLLRCVYEWQSVWCVYAWIYHLF